MKTIPRFKIWIEKNGRHVLGEGGAEILRTIENFGSIVKAAEKLGISYRKCWNYIKEIEKVVGEKVTYSERGGRKGGKTTLTETGKELLRRFDEMRRVADSLEDEMRSLSSISARNRLEGKVISIKKDKLSAMVEVEIKKSVIKVMITREALEDLEIKKGDVITAIVKATEVVLAKD